MHRVKGSVQNVGGNSAGGGGYPLCQSLTAVARNSQED